MKIAITGANGFIGSFLVEELKSIKNMEIIPISRNKKSAFFSNYSVESLTSFFNGCDIVVHLAGKRPVEDTYSQYEDNSKITNNVSLAAKRNNVKKMIYISSISVYSDQKILPWSEKEKVSPRNQYGLSKYIGEEICRLNLNNTETKLYCLRLGHVFGANEKNNYMINLFIRQAYNNEKIILHDMNYGKRQLIYVKDVVNAIINVINHDCNDYSSDVINIGSKNVLTNFEIAEQISRISGVPLEIKKIGEEKQENFSSYMSTEKARNILNFESEYSFHDALREIYKSMEETGQNVPILY